MKKKLFIIALFFLVYKVHAQDSQTDSLKKELAKTTEDTAIFNNLSLISWSILFSDSDTGLVYAQKALLLGKKLEDPHKEAEALLLCGTALSVMGNYPLSIDYLLKGLHIEEQFKSSSAINTYWGLSLFRLLCFNLSESYNDQGDYERALYYYNKGKPDQNASEDELMESFLRLSMIYEKASYLDAALLYGQKAFDLDIKMNGKSMRGYIPIILGNVYYKRKDYRLALNYYRIAQSNPDISFINKDAIEVYNGIAKTFMQIHETDSSIFYAQKALQRQKNITYRLGALDTYSLLAGIYKSQGKLDSTVKYLEQANSLRDSIFNQQKNKEVQNLSFNEQLRQQEILREKKEYQNKIRVYLLLGASLVFLLIASLLYRNNRQKQKAKDKIEKAYGELKTTQAQLIQSEKMASLGELTAGIAHEIQNPLNFVNNFSEVNDELLKELKVEAEKGNLEEVKAIAKDIAFNSEKINYHGKRADSIVKAMLQHSRISSGQKEATDINALADEYLRLAYHGLRAKDKSFNAAMKTDFDESIGRINIIPQDIGRVILNLINNAFYAVDEKKKQNISGYEPTVSVSTKKTNGKVEIKVSDNGNGIPQKVLDKIFQPFFTTKPTGQGTGLGLSLSYDIVKAHGGEIKVETKEKEGTEFIVILPA